MTPVLTDIEGTTSSISFVRDVLFPYARERLPGFVAEHATDSLVRTALDAVRDELGTPGATDANIAIELQRWIDEDRKATPLKTLQGLMWRAGYQQGDYRAHLYPDARDALQRWAGEGRPVYVYSSGSIKAQHLFFEYSDAGDVRSWFRGHYDTTSGSKHETASYQSIAHDIDVEPGTLLFLSDVEGELDAAHEAGLQTCQLVRPEDGTVASRRHSTATTFDDVETLLASIE